MKSVSIFGGGISGLTVAHELSDKGYKIDIYESDDILGGMAKSRRDGNSPPSEHSWRGYGPFYLNFFHIAKQIPGVYDNLSKPIDFFLVRDEISDIKPGLSFTDKIITGYYGLKYLMSNKRREDYYTTKIVPILENKLSNDGYDFLIEHIIGPGLGMEIKDVSYAHLYKVLSIQTLNDSKYKHYHPDGDYYHEAKDSWTVMKKDTNAALFDPWKKYLLEKNIKIHYNTKLIKLNEGKNNIESAVIETPNGFEIIYSDIYVVAINPFNAELIFRDSGMNNLYEQHRDMNKDTDSNQLSFRLGIDKKIKFPTRSAFSFPDSEFNITLYPQDEHWDPDVYLGDGISTLLSGTCIVLYKPGNIYNKTGSHLTKDQMMNEIIYQILRSKSFQKIIYDNNRFYLVEKDIIYREIWEEWSETMNDPARDHDMWGERSGKLQQNPKKWVNNVYNEKYRPSQATDISNLYLSGAHTKTSIDIWSMEGAVESGKRTADIISRKYGDGEVYYFEHKDPSYLNIFKSIDDILYSLYLPNILDTIILIITVLILVRIFKSKNYV